jgi:hypothetical protein
MVQQFTNLARFIYPPRAFQLAIVRKIWIRIAQNRFFPFGCSSVLTLKKAVLSSACSEMEGGGGTKAPMAQRRPCAKWLACPLVLDGMGPLGIQSIDPFIRCLPCADECVSKYGNGNAWKYCTRVFDYMTLAAVCGSNTVELMNTVVYKAVEIGSANRSWACAARHCGGLSVVSLSLL